MARKKKKAQAKPASSSASSPGSELAALQADIRAANTAYRALLATPGGDYEHLRLTHLAAQHLWHLRSDLCYLDGNHDGARKASMTAEGHGKLAAKLARDSVIDRVAALEREVDLRRGFGADLDKLD